MTMSPTKYNGNNGHPLPRTKYMKHTLYLTLEEMFNGTIRKLAVNKNIVCIVCNGSGSVKETVEYYDTCEECNGDGVRKVLRRSQGIEEVIKRDCELCWGKKKAIIFEDRCMNCFGRKTVPDQSILIVRVKRGTRHGQKIIYKDEGTQKPNMRPGDVVVILEAIEHQTFKRQGDDLIMTITLDLVESLCGFERVIQTMDKRKLFIKVPKGKVTQDYDIKYLPGEGMPKYINPSERGNLIIQFEVNLPTTIPERYWKTLNECLPPRELIDNIPSDVIECNMFDMAPADSYHDPINSVYEESVHVPIHSTNEESDDQHKIDLSGTINHTSDQCVQDDDIQQSGSEGPDDDQGRYYSDDHCAVQDDNVHDSDYEQQYYHDVHSIQQKQFYQQEEDCESLESYDASQQFRFTN